MVAGLGTGQARVAAWGGGLPIRGFRTEVVGWPTAGGRYF